MLPTDDVVRDHLRGQVEIETGRGTMPAYCAVRRRRRRGPGWS